MNSRKQIKNQFSNKIIIFLVCLIAFLGCSKNKYAGLYEVTNGYSDYYRNFLLLKKDNTYQLFFPSVEHHHDDGIVESKGTWSLEDREILFTSYNQPTFYSLLDVEEKRIEDFDSVKFEFIVKNRFLDTVYSDIPFATIGNLRLSGNDDTTYNLNEQPKFTTVWNKEKRNFFLLEDISGYLAPYDIKDKNANYFVVYYSQNGLNKLKRYDFFYKEPLKILGDTLLYRNTFKFVKKI